MMQDDRTNAEAIGGLFDINSAMRDEFTANPAAPMKQAAPMSIMDQMDERKGKFRNRLGLMGHLLSGGTQSDYGDADLLAAQKSSQAQAAMQEKMGMAQPYIDMMRDDDPSNNAEAMFGLSQMGVGDSAMQMMFPGTAAGKPSEFYAGDLIFDEETGRYGQIMMDKHGGESQTKWYEPGQIPKEAMLSRESFDSKYNSTLEARGVAQGNYNQTQRAMDSISQISDDDWTAGLAGDIESFWKQNISGNEDREQWAKKSAINVRNLQQMGMLPPGPATDKDVDLVMKGAPGDQASKETWMEYLSAAQRLNEKAVYFQNAKMQWMDERGLRGMQGFNKHWEETNPYREDVVAPQQGAGGQPGAAPQGAWDGKRTTFTGMEDGAFDAIYDSMPSGTRFTGPDGTEYTKP